MTNFICPNPNCGYHGPGRQEKRGNLGAAILLIVLFFPIGLVYLFTRSGYRWVCPDCGIDLRKRG